MAATALAASLLLTLCWAFTPSPRLLVMATAFVPFALFGYAVAAVGSLAVRALTAGRLRRGLTGALVVSVLGAVLHAGLLLPSYLGSHASGRPDLTVMSSNLRLGLGDTAEVTRLAKADDVDVLVLQEVTPAAFTALADLRQELPHMAGMSFVGARGTVVLSRYPLEDVTQLKIYQGTWTMQVAAPEPFTLIAVHTTQPAGRYIALWHSDHRSLLWNTTLAMRAGPTVVAGDFNATLDHRPMRKLLDLGLSDASRQSNAGWQPTWPGAASKHALPFGIGAMAIDHVLVSEDFSTISTSTHAVEGSDHRTLVARLEVR